MSMHGGPLRVFVITIFLAHFTHPSHSALDSFVYVGCSQLKYTPGSPYESAVNSVLSSAVNSAALSNYNNFKASLPQSGAVYGLFQCRGDLSISGCRSCVARAVSRLGPSCAGASGGALQLDGCFVRYDNTSFVGDEDKAVVSDRCGPAANADDADVLARRDAVLSYLAGGGGSQFFRVAGSGKVQGVAQWSDPFSSSSCFSGSRPHSIPPWANSVNSFTQKSTTVGSCLLVNASQKSNPGFGVEITAKNGFYHGSASGLKGKNIRLPSSAGFDYLNCSRTHNTFVSDRLTKHVFPNSKPAIFIDLNEADDDDEEIKPKDCPVIIALA